MRSAPSPQTALTVLLALIVHQVFRRHETYDIVVHASLLLGPPVLVALLVPSHATSATFFDTARDLFKTYFTTLALSVVTYRLSPLHPLARYLGPYRRRISHFVSAFISITGDRSRYLAALHQKYGDIVRTGPNEVCIINPSLIDPLLGSAGVPKGPIWVGGSLGDKNLPLVGIANIEMHMQRRRAWNRGLAPAALKGYEDVAASRAKQLIQRLEEQVGSEVILSKWLSHFTYDFMSDMAFGGGSELMRDGDKDSIWSTIGDGMKIAEFLAHVPWLGVYLGHIPPAVRPLKMLLRRGAELADRRLARGSTTRDLFHYLNNEDLPDLEPPPRPQLVDDGVLAVVAGSDTTSIALTSTFYCILTNPEAYATLQAEVDRYYPIGEDPYNHEHHRNMPYLQAVINEALRLFPPVPGGSERRVPHTADPVIVGSLYLPPGTSIFLPPWVLQRDPRNFTFALSFWPERWLIASGQMRVEDARLPATAQSASQAGLEKGTNSFEFVHKEVAYLPFSYGPMNCPGKGLSMLEMRMLVVAILQRFKVRLSDGWDPAEFERNFKDYFNATRPDLPVTLEPRW